MDETRERAGQRETAALWLLFERANADALDADHMGLIEDDFTWPQHRQIFRWICDRTLDAETVIYSLKGKLWPAEIAHAVNSVMSYFGLERACESALIEVRDAGRIRRLEQAIGHELKTLDLVTTDVQPLVTLLQQLDSVRRKGTARPAILRSAASLCEQYTSLAEPVIGGLLRRGEVCNIVGSAKTGKSWLLHDLLCSLALGTRWLDRYHCAPSHVVLVDNELHEATLAHRLRDVAAARGVPTGQLDRLNTISHRGRLADIYAVIAEVERACLGSPPDIVAIDALYRCLPAGASENDNAAVTAIYNALDGLAQRTGAAIICVHHTSKGEQAGKSVTDVGSGAGAQSRAADTHLVLRPHEEDGCVVLDAAIRSFPPIAPCVLRLAHPVWHIDDTLDAGRLRTPKREQRQRPDHAAVSDGEVHDLAAWVGAEGCLHSTLVMLAERKGLTARRAAAVIREAVERGAITRSRSGYGAPVTYHRNGMTLHNHAEPPI